jgi:cytochrome c556
LDFRNAANEAEADQDEAAFKKRMKKIAKPVKMSAGNKPYVD